jgi:uncharacterized protein YkwD/uncharacterized protein YraI
MRLVRTPGFSPALGARVVVALASVALSGAGALAAPAPPSSTAITTDAAVETADACLDSEEVNFLALINDYRASSGLRPLSVSASLSSAAAYHSIDMAENGYLDHALADGTTVAQNMANFGYNGGTNGENIAAGTQTAAEAMQIWQGSAAHNANMLSSNFGAIGIGRAYDAASPYGWYWTTDFGDESDGPGWLCGEAAPASKTLSLFQSVDGATSTSDVNLRTGPGYDYDVVTVLARDTPMTVTGREQEGFLPVKVDGQFGWVDSEWVQRGAIALDQTAAPDQSLTATSISPVELRGAPDSDGGVMSTIPAAAVVTLTGDAQDGYLGVVFDGQQGWADAAYLQVADASSTTTALQPATAENDATQTAALAPASGLDAPPGAQAVTTTEVNLRSQPSANAEVLSILPAGSPVSLTGSQANGYVNVRVNGQAGWIDSTYLQ